MLQHLGVDKVGLGGAVVCVPELGRHVGDVGVVVDNVGVVTLDIGAIVVTIVSVITLGRNIGSRGLLVRILLNFRHRIDLSMIKRFEMSATGLLVRGAEMQISLRILGPGPHPGGQRVVRMVDRHPASDSETLGTGDNVN